MDVYFMFVQLIGLLAFLLLALSYYRKTTNKILIIQILSTVLYCIHYYLLGAYSGLFICMFEVILDYGYYKTTWDNKLFLASIPMYIVAGIFSYHTFLDLFSIFASLTDRYSLTKERKKVVIGSVFAYTLWVIYDIHVKSISGVITDGIIVISNISILLREYNIIKTKKKTKRI